MKTGYKQTEIGVIPEDWEVKRLGELAPIATGNTPPTNDPSNYGDEFLFVGPVDMGENKFISRTEKMLSKKGFSIARKFPADSILFVSIGSTIGKCGIAPVDLTSNQQINAIFPSAKFSVDYLFYAVSAAASRIKSQAGEQAVPIVNKTQFAESIVPVPPLPEQRAIAGALSEVDALLGAQEALLAKKRDLKQAAMQQLLTGQKRLPSFTGEWQVKRLGDVATLKNGYAFKSETYTPIGEFKVITIANVQDGEMTTDGCNSIQTEPDDLQPHQRLSIGDILISMTGNVGRICKVSEPLCLLNQRVGKLIPTTINRDFLFITLRQTKFLSAMIGTAKGGAQPNLSSADIVNYSFNAPVDPAEQTAIAAVLSDMDAEIAALEAQRDKTRTLKQGMMQELLTGRIRLV